MSEEFATPAPLKTAVLFLVFNRPDTTKQVFDTIRQAKPPRLYVAADGPRVNREGEADRAAQVRKIATEVDWPCELKTLFRDENLGCKIAVSSGIDWFFENEEKGIILEDDCLPSNDFFSFCDTILDFYQTDERVWVVTGNNFQDSQYRGDSAYYFSRYNHVWGWATWRRAWVKRNMDITFWPSWKKSTEYRDFFKDKVEKKYWTSIFQKTFNNEIDTWDYSWTATVWFHGGLTATPNANLISNIGFGADSTHTTKIDSPLAAIATRTLGEITHPNLVVYDEAADRYVFDNVFGGRLQRFPNILYSLPMRAARKFFKIIKKKLNYA
jgi:hypothetical protein